MKSLFIKDLSLAQPLDREAASAVRGGITSLPVEPDGGNGSGPAVEVTPLWALPALPVFPFAPGWCGTPVPQQPRAPISTPPGDRMFIQ